MLNKLQVPLLKNASLSVHPQRHRHWDPVSWLNLRPFPSRESHGNLCDSQEVNHMWLKLHLTFSTWGQTCDCAFNSVYDLQLGWIRIKFYFILIQKITMKGAIYISSRPRPLALKEVTLVMYKAMSSDFYNSKGRILLLESSFKFWQNRSVTSFFLQCLLTQVLATNLLHVIS